MSAGAEIASVSSEFDIFAHRPIQTSVLDTTEVAYKPIAPAVNDTYIDLDIKLYVKCKLILASGKNVDFSDHTGVRNNFIHSLFSQCNVNLNGVNITQAIEHYQCRSYLETLMTYGTDAAATDVSNAYWYLDAGEMQPVDPSAENLTAKTNNGFILRWYRISASREVQLFGRIHNDICNVPLYLLPGVRLQIRVTKGRSSFYLMNKSVDSKTVSKILDAQLLVRRVRPNPTILLAHTPTLKNRSSITRYNLTRVELKTFTFAAGFKSLYIDNAVLGRIPKHLLFTMVKNTDFNGSLDSNPYKFRHYDISDFSLFMNSIQFSNEGLTLGMDHEKTSVMGYRTLFEASSIHHSNTGLQITHDMYIKGYFMLLFVLTPDRGVSEGHTSHPENGSIRIELKFNKPLPEAITCLLYLEFDNSVLIDFERTVTTDF